MTEPRVSVLEDGELREGFAYAVSFTLSISSLILDQG